MTTMIEARGAEYIMRWIETIPRQTGLSISHLATAVRTVTGADLRAADLTAALATDTPPVDVANLTPDQAKAVVSEMRAVSNRIDAAARTQCHYCGLPLRGGRCDECI